MAATGYRLSRRSWVRLASWTVFGTFGCMAVSLGYNYLSFRGLGAEAMRQGLVSATVLPILLAGPLFFLLTLKLRELAIVNHRLNDLASVDALTGCLNRRVFTAAVDRHLELAGGDRWPDGALLVIDADRFKAINDRFGHDAGDEALRLVAEAIRSAVRSEDIVGRLGGEEFGVFLVRSTQNVALDVAERIRNTIETTKFAPRGRRHRLSVSVGLTMSRGATEFTELFRAADKGLYEAKSSGRNRVRLALAPSLAPTMADVAAE